MLESYQNLIDFLIGVYGSFSEIVLFQVDRDMKGARVLKAKNSDYRAGDEIGPIGKRILASSGKGYNYLINLNNESDPEEQRKLSYFVIRDPAGKVIGLLLITFKTGSMLLTKRMFDQILGFEAVNENPQEYNDFYHELETSDFSISKYTKTIISNIIAESEIPVECMTMADKGEIIRRLEAMEVFHIKSSVKEAAQQLMISVPTVYRLMKK